MDALVDRVADLRVGDRALDHPLRAAPDELRPEERGVVRLVPRGPEAHGRDRPAVLADVLPAVAGRRRIGEIAEQRVAVGRPVGRLPAVRPLRRAGDREEHLHPVRGGVERRAVVERPVVGGVAGIARLEGARLRDAELPAPVEVHAEDADVQLLVPLEHLAEVAEERLALVVDADLHAGARSRGHAPGRGHAEPGGGRQGRRQDTPAVRHQRARGRTTGASGAGPLPAGPRAPSRGPAVRA